MRIAAPGHQPRRFAATDPRRVRAKSRSVARISAQRVSKSAGGRSHRRIALMIVLISIEPRDLVAAIRLDDRDPGRSVENDKLLAEPHLRER